MIRSLVAVGIDVTTVNSEHGPWQLEINYAPAWGVEAVDQAFTFKKAIKEIAKRSGYLASFMTQPAIAHCTNGCHFNQSLWQEDRNVFLDPKDPDGISDVCRHYLAGQLVHALALCALASPTVNCFKRYQSSPVTPTVTSWGIQDRSAAVRVKAFKDNRFHIENRLGGGAANPYLLMAGCLAAGIDGLQRQLERLNFLLQPIGLQCRGVCATLPLGASP